MKIRILVLVVVAAATSGPAPAQMMMGGGMMHGQQGGMTTLGMCPMCQMMGSGMTQGGCIAELDQLELDPKTLAALQDAHFELQKTAVRKSGDLKILQMELQRLVGNQDFDLDAARKKARAMVDIQAELHGAHLGFLHQLAGKFSSEQWQTFQEWKQHRMMDRVGERFGRHSGPDQTGPGEDGMADDMMRGGGMMHRKGAVGHGLWGD